MASSETVQLNVGGRHFEVSRSLIEQRSETMLNQLVSEKWQGNPSERIFIDRDGDIFRHVLNYLRYGSILLPITIPKSMFNCELDYYGIPAEENHIKQVASFGEAAKLVKQELENATVNYV